VEPTNATGGAAFFDLDRTLLRGASGPVLTQALRTAGLVGSRSLPGESVFNRVYHLFGENRVFMELTRQLARVASGWPIDRVQAAAEEAVEGLLELLQPYATPLFQQHRDAGRAVVLATTTPYELIKPFAEALGFDDVIATRYGVRDGAFDGTFADGGFVWGRGKLEAVRAWAEARGVSLAESFAYSDSFFDLPLLGAVGHPVAVNPDVRLDALARARRWPVLHLDAPDGVPKLFGVEPQHLLLQLFRPELIRYARVELRGTEHIPRSGGAIIALNHRSYFDIVAGGCAISKSGRPIRVLAKREMFEAPVIGPVIAALGAIRVDRGSGSDAPLQSAAQALECGELVGIFPQGTIPRGEAFFEPVLKGRKGAARLAAMTRVPVIPIGIWGSEKVWPRRSKLPYVWNVLRPPRVQVRVGPPVDLAYDDLSADTERIMRAIMGLLPAESLLPYVPTSQELARTRPSA
jgi:putative phosphoserine phosphatase/1-acylglycerol-3-phosphate O-acyltransferase